MEAALQTELLSVSVSIVRSGVGKLQENRYFGHPQGSYLSQRPTFTFDPLFHAGCYYVQEASSMFVEQVLRTYITGPVVMLDLCAAPGG